MKNKSLILLVLALLMPLFVFAQNVKIVGKTNRPNILVRLLACDDQITFCETLLVETQSDSEGKFVLETTIDEITPVNIAIGLERADFMIVPNGFYDIEITVADVGADVSYFDRNLAQMSINTIKDDGFYTQFLRVQDIVDTFIYDNFTRIVRERKYSLLDELDNQINTTFGKIKFKYINDYVKYRKASLVMAVDKKKVLTEYFDNQEVLYTQPAYFMVFDELFKDDVKDTDFLSRNPQLAELIKLNNLRRKFFNNSIDKKTALESADNIKKSSKYHKNKAIAAHLIEQLDDMTYDSAAPDFALKDKDGNLVKLADYQNNMVLLQFVDGYSPLNDHEISTLNDLQKQWGDTIQIVTIATKESFEDFVQLFDNKGYKWPVLNLGDDILLLEKYHVRMCPQYVILKKKGRVGMSPAPSPDHNLEYHVRRISKYL